MQARVWLLSDQLQPRIFCWRRCSWLASMAEDRWDMTARKPPLQVPRVAYPAK